MRHGLAIIFASLLVFTGCPTDMKRFRTGAENANDPATSIGSFNVSFSYRDVTTNPANRVVQVQANHLLQNAKLETVCGNTGDNCTCDFYTSSTDTAPVASSSVTLSPLSNVLSCTIAGAVAPANYTFLRVRTDDGLKNSGLVNISTTLSAEMVLGDLDTTQVRKVFPYACTRSFIEGEGVSGGSISCGVTLALGFLYADYSFYVYQGVDPNDKNTDDRPTTPALYPTYCQRGGDARITCGAQAASPSFGLMKEPVGFFQTTVFLTSKPEGTTTSSLFGYAALADTNGFCPPGLLAVRSWRADPPSITKDYLPGGNPPSNFINITGNLNSVVVSDASTTPATFKIFRNPNSVVCNAGANDCSVAQFAGTSLIEEVTYGAQNPIICALSPAVLSTL